MARFLIMYNGPATGPGASHAGWMTWFSQLGNKLADKGSPIKQASGTSVAQDGTASKSAYTINGYGVLNAQSKEEAIALVSTHPFLTNGSEYKIEVFELGR